MREGSETVGVKILLIHNFYQQPGGESVVVESEAALLSERGHEVFMYTDDNKRIPELSRSRLSLRAIWSRESYRAIRELAQREEPDIAHVHNTLPLISPSAYHALRAENVPIVQTLHNFGLECLSNNFYRNGGVCEDCLGRPIPWPGVFHACYRGDRMASSVVAMRLMAHRAIGTYSQTIDLYIALTDFAREKLSQGGVPAEKIVVKPNFINSDPGPRVGIGTHALFVGRLSPEKGIRTLLDAWRLLDGRAPLVIVGDGPLWTEAKKVAREAKDIRLVGWQSREAVFELMRTARILIVPSECYEGFPVVVAEAFAHGLPVIASDLGGLASIVDHGRTGIRFRPGDAQDLARSVKVIWDDAAMLQGMNRAARAEFESKYTAERNYERLIEIYNHALERRRKTRSRAVTGCEPVKGL